jgi:threonine dehydratase
MVGGHAPGLKDELLYRFEFPERPGALMKFLSLTPGRWNISLFHYRNQGGAYGTVCVGLQVPAGDRGRVASFLKRLNYPYVDESANPAYHLFLGRL